MNHRILCLPLALAAALTLPLEARAQVRPGLHIARATDSFGGTNGVGGSLQFDLPTPTVDLFVAGEYFFPDCDSCSLWGGSVDVHLALPVTVLTPYGTAGLVLRETDVSDTSVRTGGIGFGVGLNVNTLVVGTYVEGRYELMDGSGDQVVLRLGIRF